MGCLFPMVIWSAFRMAIRNTHPTLIRYFFQFSVDNANRTTLSFNPIPKNNTLYEFYSLKKASPQYAYLRGWFKIGIVWVWFVNGIVDELINHEKRTIRSYYGYNINKNISYPNITFDNQFFADTRPGLKFLKIGFSAREHEFHKCIGSNTVQW